MIARTFVVAALCVSSLELAPVQSQQIRVYVHTEDDGDPRELKARKTLTTDLGEALKSKKRTLVVVDEEERAEVVVEVVGLGMTVPKVVIGLGPRPGDPTATMAPVKNVEVRVQVTAGTLSVSLKNKNRAADNPRGWKSAAEDLADQIDKWVFERRAKIRSASSAHLGPVLHDVRPVSW